MFLFFRIRKADKHYNIKQKNKKISLSDSLQYRKRGISTCTCIKASLMVETVAVLPFFACFLVFILYFFRILQVQTGVTQALQYTGRTIAAQCSNENRETIETKNYSEEKSHISSMAKAQLLFRKTLQEQDCPTQYVQHGIAGISLSQSALTGNYIELKAVYQMKLPVGMLGLIRYQVVQQARCRKWTGYQLGQDKENDDTWLYYTAYGRVYHTSRECAYLDLSIRGIPASQLINSRNQSGGRYYPCEECTSGHFGSGMVYITTYGDRYHTSLTCSGLKRTIYMIRRSRAAGKKICKKCGGG